MLNMKPEVLVNKHDKEQAETKPFSDLSISSMHRQRVNIPDAVDYSV